MLELEHSFLGQTITAVIKDKAIFLVNFYIK